MSNQPLVSIICPFLNAEKYIEETIQSVLGQTYDSWELLLVDDGSTDASSWIAQQYAKNDPRVRYVEHPEHQNLGKSISRNVGIRGSKGDYIALLDADDLYLPQKLERQVAILESQTSAGLVYGPTQYWHSWVGCAENVPSDYVARLGVQPNALFAPPTLLTQYLRDGAIVPCTCGLLARRQVVEAIGGFEEHIQHLYEDQVFLAKICLAATVYVDSECWDKYRRHAESSWHLSLSSGQEHDARLVFLHWLESYLFEQHIQNADLWRALRRQFWPYQYPRLYAMIRRARGIVRQVRKRM